MRQQALWIDDLLTAQQALVDAVGPKEVGKSCYPELDVESAAKRVQHNLNPISRERFSGDDTMVMLKLGRRKGCHVLAAYLMREAGYEEPRAVDLGTEVARAAEDVAALHEQAQRRMAKLMSMRALLEDAAKD